MKCKATSTCVSIQTFLLHLSLPLSLVSLLPLSLDDQKPMCSIMWQFSVLCNREEGGTDTDKMCHLVLMEKNSRNLLIQQTLLVFLPKVAALNQKLFTQN